MDFNVNTNRVVLNANETKKLIEAAAILRHVKRLAGVDASTTISGAGDWAQDAIGGVKNVLGLVEYPIASAGDVKKLADTLDGRSGNEAAKEQSEKQSAEPLVK